ncbi:MAG TPA: ribonuclease III [Candidatus Methylomirabilis sp.]|nr:ribonuclease III [Candidatus Methylomirabilis sp.]
MNDLSLLEERLGATFKNKDLLQQALVHRSYLNEHSDFYLNHNERLEFLGDAVLELVVTEFLYRQYPKEQEGELTNWRASLVNAKMLAVIAEEVGIEDNLLLSRGEAKDKNSKARQFILADAVEAVIGALYLDQGIEQVRKFVGDKILTKLDYILKNELYFDPKSKFQEISQEKFGITPHYRVLKEEGPDHAKIFDIGLYIAEELIATGHGSSKQEAEVEAAKAGLEAKNWQ